jgi:hypothetical protein
MPYNLGVSRAVWTIVLLSGAGLLATAFRPSWHMRGEGAARPIEVIVFLEAHVIGAVSALAAIAWLARLPWPRVVFWTQALITILSSLLVGLFLHLLVFDCFEHHGRSPDIGITTVPAVGVTLLWYVPMWLMVRSPAVDPRARSGRVAATGGAVALLWLGAFELGGGALLGNHLGLVASLFLLIAAWNAALE